MWVVLVALLGFGIGLLVVHQWGDKNDSQTGAVVPAAQVANVRQACLGWMQSATTAQPRADWCQGMANWMSQSVASGDTPRTYPWGDPDHMLSNCRQWVTSNNGSSADVKWCDDMVNWMRDHMDDGWNNSMDHGWMMGN